MAIKTNKDDTTKKTGGLFEKLKENIASKTQVGTAAGTKPATTTVKPATTTAKPAATTVRPATTTTAAKPAATAVKPAAAAAAAAVTKPAVTKIETDAKDEDEVTRGEALYEFWQLAGSPSVMKNLTYKDVHTLHKCAPAIRWATDIGVTEGYYPDQFGIDDPVTREQLIVFIYRYIKKYDGGFKDNKTYKLQVADADDVSDWAQEAIAYCVANKYVTVDKAKKFYPKAHLTVAETKELLEKAIPAENEKLGIFAKIGGLFSKK
jgi:hypothetical protein